MSKMSKQMEMIKKQDFLSPYHLDNNLRKNQTHLSAREIQRMMQLEGDCKILRVQYIQFNILKALFLGFLVSISVIGLLFVKHFKRLRVALFYKSLQKNQNQKATHIYIQGTDKNDQICIILQKQAKEEKQEFFNLKDKEIPLAFAQEKHINQIISQQFINKGLTQSYAKERQLQYVMNQHKVQIPGYFEYLFECMTGPFFIFQYIVSTIYILENVALFGICMIIFSWLTTSINYILQNIVNIFLPVFIYRSEPWKQKFYRNKAFTILILVNIVLFLTIFFTTGSWSWIDLQKIGIKEAGVVLLIMFGFVVISFGYNRFIDLMVFHEKNYEQYYAENKQRGKLKDVKAESISQ